MCNQCCRNSGVLKDFFVDGGFFHHYKNISSRFCALFKSSGGILWLSTLVPLKYFERCSQANKLIALFGVRDTINIIILY